MFKSIQDYLSFGYLYLLALGILTEAMYYGLLGINFINYTTVLDVLLSPIGILTDNYRMPLMILIVFIILLIIFSGFPRFHNKYKGKSWYKRLFNVDKLDERFSRVESAKAIGIFLAILIFSMFVGYGLGSGAAISEKLKKGTLKAKEELVFTDDSSKKVRILGQTSAFVIYAEEGKSEVIASPLLGVIKQIRTLDK